MSSSESAQNEAAEKKNGDQTKERESGTVVRWIPDRGFGFIKPDTPGKDLFVHSSGLDCEGLSLGERVEFERGPDTSGRGERAIKVMGNRSSGGYEKQYDSFHSGPTRQKHWDAPPPHGPPQHWNGPPQYQNHWGAPPPYMPAHNQYREREREYRHAPPPMRRRNVPPASRELRAYEKYKQEYGFDEEENSTPQEESEGPAFEPVGNQAVQGWQNPQSQNHYEKPHRGAGASANGSTNHVYNKPRFDPQDSRLGNHEPTSIIHKPHLVQQPQKVAGNTKKRRRYV